MHKNNLMYLLSLTLISMKYKNNNNKKQQKTKKISTQIRDMVPWIPDCKKSFQNLCTF